VVFGIMTASIAGGCGEPTTKPPSRFIKAFSPQEAIKRSYVQAEGKKPPTVSGGDTSSGGLGITHRSMSVDLSLNEPAASEFLSRVKNETADQLRKNGARSTGEGSGNDEYYLEYSDGAIAGMVEIWGIRGADDNYRVIIIIAER